MKTAAIIKIGRLNDPDADKRGKIDLVDFELPEMGDEDLKIRVAYCAICGSDPHVAEGAFGTTVPRLLGHEISGVIEDLGKNAVKKGFKIGDRVAGNFLHFCGICYFCQNEQQHFCRSTSRRQAPGMSEFVIWHEAQAYKLPDNVSLRAGCMLEPLSVAVRAADKIGMKVGQRTVVCGGGPIGLLTLQVLRLQGASNLTLIEPIAQRRELALRFGAEHTIDPFNEDVAKKAMEITDGLGFDVAVEVSGSPKGAESLPPITARGGTILYGAMYPNEYELPLNLFSYLYRGDMTLTGLFLSPYTFPRAVQLLAHIDLEPFIEKAFPLSDVAEAFDVHMSGAYPKVLIRCNDLD